MQYAASTTECPTCNSVFRGSDRNEDGSPYIESTRCAHPGCGIYLCGAGCQELSSRCDGCRQRFCTEHMLFTIDGECYCTACSLELRRAMLAETGCTLEEMVAWERMVA
jgi:hypothetical protein